MYSEPGARLLIFDLDYSLLRIGVFVVRILHADTRSDCPSFEQGDSLLVLRMRELSGQILARTVGKWDSGVEEQLEWDRSFAVAACALSQMRLMW
jgi:hypothetical protein